MSDVGEKGVEGPAGIPDTQTAEVQAAEVQASLADIDAAAAAMGVPDRPRITGVKQTISRPLTHSRGDPLDRASRKKIIELARSKPVSDEQETEARRVAAFKEKLQRATTPVVVMRVGELLGLTNLPAE